MTQAVKENPKTNFKKMSQAEFDERTSDFGMDMGEVKALHATERKSLQKNMTQWYTLSTRYRGIRRAVKKLQKDGKTVVVVTLRNRGAVIPLLQKYGIPIHSENVFDSTKAGTKRELLEMAAKQKNIPVEKIVLVDDTLKQLELAKNLGASAAYAKWGYGKTPRREMAGKGITMVRRPRGMRRTVRRIQNPHPVKSAFINALQGIRRRFGR